MDAQPIEQQIAALFRLTVEEMPYPVLKETILYSSGPSLRVAAIQEAARRLKA